MLVRRQIQIISLPQHNKVLENHNYCLRITGFTFTERGEDIDPTRLVKGRLGNHWFFGHVCTIDAMPIQNSSEFIIDVHIDKGFWVLFRNIQGFRIHLLSILASKPFIITRKDEMNVFFFLMREKLSTCNAAVVNVHKYCLQIDSTWNNQQSISFNGFNWLSLVQCLYSDGFFFFFPTHALELLNSWQCKKGITIINLNIHLYN